MPNGMSDDKKLDERIKRLIASDVLGKTFEKRDKARRDCCFLCRKKEVIHPDIMWCLDILSEKIGELSDEHSVLKLQSAILESKDA